MFNIGVCMDNILQVDRNSAAQKQFESAAIAANMDPDDKWVGGYAEYEWDHLRRLLSCYDMDVADKKILELGCNVGGSSVVMAALGGQITAIDIDPDMVRIAQANIGRHNQTARAMAQHIKDTRTLPYDDASFDYIIANSVLEYVRPDQLEELIGELHRVLKSGGGLFICGTASRIVPKEIHSGRWLVNYIPQFIDRIIGKRIQRGLSPYLLKKAITGRFKSPENSAWLDARRAIHGELKITVKLVNLIAGWLHINPAWLSPHIEMKLIKTD